MTESVQNIMRKQLYFFSTFLLPLILAIPPLHFYCLSQAGMFIYPPLQIWLIIPPTGLKHKYYPELMWW